MCSDHPRGISCRSGFDVADGRGQPVNRAAPVEFAPFRIESWAKTHEGRVRDHNEDSYCAKEPQGLWAVADGMGGHEGGEWASGEIVRALDELELPDEFDAA